MGEVPLYGGQVVDALAAQVLVLLLVVLDIVNTFVFYLSAITFTVPPIFIFSMVIISFFFSNTFDSFSKTSLTQFRSGDEFSSSQHTKWTPASAQCTHHHSSFSLLLSSLELSDTKNYEP